MSHTCMESIENNALSALVVVPAALNAAVVMGLVPTTGLTLPFLSHGSNSLLCAAVAVGVPLRAAASEAPASPRRGGATTPRGFARA